LPEPKESKRFRIRARGPLACFTRPELKVERVSYDVITPSAARGLFDAILWKPAILWQIHEIAVLAPIVWTSFRRNEVNSRASPNAAPFFAEEDRAQRNTTALKDVDYVVTASFCMTEKAGAEDNVRKFEEMFERRLQKGQHFHQPYLGCREFAAEVEPAPENFEAIGPRGRRPLGLMLFDLNYKKGNERTRPLFFEAWLEDGILKVPSFEEVIRDNSSPAGRTL
jgi:CRISPR-associated protein Cas5d